MANPICHFELVTPDVEKARDFYSRLFDWKIEAMPGADYWLINAGREPGGGMMKTPAPGVPTAWTMYVLVNDVENALARVKDLGGRVLTPKTEIPGIGWFGVFADPQGAVLALFEELKK